MLIVTTDIEFPLPEIPAELGLSTDDIIAGLLNSSEEEGSGEDVSGEEQQEQQEQETSQEEAEQDQSQQEPEVETNENDGSSHQVIQ